MLTDAEKDKIDIAERMLGRDKLEEKDIDWFLRKHTKREMFYMLRQERHDRNAAKKATRAAVAVQEEERIKRSKLAMKLEDAEKKLRGANVSNKAYQQETQEMFTLKTEIVKWQGRVKTLISEVDRQEAMIRVLRWALKATEYDVRETIRQSIAELL